MAESETLKQIASIIHDSLGLNFSGSRLKDLEKGVIASAKELGIKSDLDSVYNWLSKTRLTIHDLKILSSHITVGETYFFREKKSLDLFVKVIVPELIAKRKDFIHHIRIWCAGCSSGEEPYSLAILLKEKFPELSSWRVSILATDINPKAIHKATKGEYSQWSFRETPEHIKQKYFIEKGNCWEISNEIKKMVDFAYLNLSEDTYPSSATNTENIDIVFCRNVFIYLSEEMITKAAAKIYDALTDGGWLITSQVELNDSYFYMFGNYVYENNFFYKKGYIKKESLTQKHTINKIKAKPFALPQKNINKHHKVSIAGKLKQTPSEEPKTAIPSLADAKAFADKGYYAKAVECIEKIISSGNADADIYYLYGTILYEQQNIDQAYEVLRKVLYLNPAHLFGQLMFGNICSQSGRNETALKCYKNALDILDHYDENDIVPEGGMTKKRMREMIENLILALKK